MRPLPAGTISKPNESPIESIKPEVLQKAPPAVANVPGSKSRKDGDTINDPLLSEKTVSTKQQRKADWAIIKEMSRYLWPKVHLRFAH